MEVRVGSKVLVELGTLRRGSENFVIGIVMAHDGSDADHTPWKVAVINGADWDYYYLEAKDFKVLDFFDSVEGATEAFQGMVNSTGRGGHQKLASLSLLGSLREQFGKVHHELTGF